METIHNELSKSDVFDALFSCFGRWDRPHFCAHAIELVRDLLKADVCALFLRARRVRSHGQRVVLTAGILQNGALMKPEDYFEKPEDASYLIGPEDYEGVTGWIATFGKPVRASGLDDVRAKKGHLGKWDRIVWDGRCGQFGSMLGVPLKCAKGESSVGVLKVERAAGPDGNPREFTQADEVTLQHIASALASNLMIMMSDSGEFPFVNPGAEKEFRLSASSPRKFECKKIGDVELAHYLTSICGSDILYFEHRKDRAKLESRLPMVLGHETVAMVRRAGLAATYLTGKRINPGDLVFVIPLQPCRSCYACRNLGENYCRHSRFMASNAPGSLRTSYLYDADLVLPLAPHLEPHHAVFAEPIANTVQALWQLGFEAGRDGFEVRMNPSRVHEFDFLHVGNGAFGNIFNTVASEEPIPRTLFVLRAPGTSKVRRSISLQHLMTKGLAILGQDQQDPSPADYVRRVENPRVLILGSGVSSYLLAMVLHHVYKIPRTNVTITGTHEDRLDQFAPFAQTCINVNDFASEATLVRHLRLAANNREKSHYDLVFECSGGEAAQRNINLGVELLGNQGVLVLFGSTDDPVSLDFASIVHKRLFLMGTYRAKLDIYRTALGFISAHSQIRNSLDSIIDRTTEIRGQKEFHDIRDENHLAEVFSKVDRRGSRIGRLLIRRLGPAFPM